MEYEVTKIAIDAIRGMSSGNFSKEQTSEAIRNALIEANGGSTKLNPKTFIRGSKLFSIVEELLPVMIEEGFKADNPLFNLVEYKNIAEGDVNEFYTEGKAQFVVAEVANGILNIRRQRIEDGSKVTVKTSMKMVRVYENLGRLLAGRITFDKFVDGVSEAFQKQVLADAYKEIASISGATEGLDPNCVYAGSFDEAKMLEIIDRVEASTGKAAKIYGTRNALRKVTTAVVSYEANSDMYNMGHYGKFNGTEMIRMNQSYKPGTKEFALDDNKVYIIAGDDAPVKMVNEGEGIMLERQATDNNDLTQEYIYGQAWGTAVICSQDLGVYTIA